MQRALPMGMVPTGADQIPPPATNVSGCAPSRITSPFPVKLSPSLGLICWPTYTPGEKMNCVPGGAAATLAATSIPGVNVTLCPRAGTTQATVKIADTTNKTRLESCCTKASSPVDLEDPRTDPTVPTRLKY